MADEGFKRKLTTILSADVEGYSRLMGEDETDEHAKNILRNNSASLFKLSLIDEFA
jgi:class 3 adenylate cyclase